MGNAVPPPLAEAFAFSVKRYIEESKIENTTKRVRSRVEAGGV